MRRIRARITTCVVPSEPPLIGWTKGLGKGDGTTSAESAYAESDALGATVTVAAVWVAAATASTMTVPVMNGWSVQT